VVRRAPSAASTAAIAAAKGESKELSFANAELGTKKPLAINAAAIKTKNNALITFEPREQRERERERETNS
jgi:hypothetical protein